MTAVLMRLEHWLALDVTLSEQLAAIENQPSK
jgi:hypothetical protein